MADSPATGDSVPGGLLDLWKGCLIDGFNDLVPTSITYDIPSDLCTATFAVAHGYLEQQIIESTATETEYQGQFRVLDSSPLTISWKPDTTPSGDATGTLGVRTPEVGGWEITYHDVGGFEMILHRTSPDATPYYLRIENDQDYGDQVGGTYEVFLARITTLTDYVDETDYTISGTVYCASGWHRASEQWCFIADHLLFYHGNRHAYNSRRSMYMFGDIISVRPGDQGHFVMFGGKNDSSDIRWSTNGYRSHNHFGQNDFIGDGGNYRYIMTNYAQDYPAITWESIGMGSAIMADEVAYPNACDGSMTFSTAPLYVMETGSIMRGFMPGLVQPMAYYSALNDVVLANVPGFDGAPIYVRLTCQVDENNSTHTIVAFRLDDWRTGVGY
jgi:hypothetical protein